MYITAAINLFCLFDSEYIIFEINDEDVVQYLEIMSCSFSLIL